MAALKPRTGDDSLEIEREGREVVVRIPVDGKECLILELKDAEASESKDTLTAVER